MASPEHQEPPNEGGSQPMGAPVGSAQPIPPEGVRRASSEPRDPDAVNFSLMLSEFRRLSDRVESIARETGGLRQFVNEGFRHMDERVNRSREAEREISDRLRSVPTRDMPGLMPKEIKPAKMATLMSTNIDEIRNWFRRARGHLKSYHIDPNEPRSVFWAAGFFDGPVSKWWYTQVATTGDEVTAGFNGINAMEEGLIQEFCGRTPAKQARINLDRATQKTTVQKYANYFREQLLELPHRHEEDNVHDFQRGLKPTIRKEVALKNPKTLAEAVQAALAVEAAEREAAGGTDRDHHRGRLAAIEGDSETDDERNEAREDSDDDDDTADQSDLYMARRLTADEVEKYKKEGRCFVCRERGHIATACPKNKNKGKKPYRKLRSEN